MFNLGVNEAWFSMSSGSRAISYDDLLKLIELEGAHLPSIPESSLREFAKSLKFHPSSHHLAHANYGRLRPHLGDEDIAKLFSMLGVDKSDFLSYRERSCQLVPEGGCWPEADQYCNPKWCVDEG